MSSQGRFARPGFAVALILAVVIAAPVVAAPALDARAADALAGGPPGRDRDRALAHWARGAPLVDLVYVLRRSELGAAEPALLEAALARTPNDRVALRRRLLARLVAIAPAESRARLPELLRGGAPLPARPRASVFRLAALLPDSGDYQQFGRALRLGLEAGLAPAGAANELPIELVSWETGEDEPARAVAALDSASHESGVVVGELLSGPTVAIATGARFLGLTLVSPTATNEEIGAIGPGLFQIGPSGFQRGRVLARAVITSRGLRVGFLVSNRAESAPFARGFAAAAESLGATVAWRDEYAAGNLTFRNEARALAVGKVDVLFWDGEAREAESLVRQLASDQVSVKLCGGSGLDPAVQHATVRGLLEGARYVAHDWRLASGSQARLDSLVRARGETDVNRLHASGYLAARLVASAVTGGALCPEETSSALALRVGRDPYLARRGFIEWRPTEATLPVYVVARGRATPIP